MTDAPYALFHPDLDIAELVAIATRVEHLADLLETAGRHLPANVTESPKHDVLRIVDHPAFAAMTGVGSLDPVTLAETFSLSSTSPARATFDLVAALPDEAAAASILDESDGDAAIRLRRHAMAIAHAAQTAEDNAITSDRDDLAHDLATYVQHRLERPLPVISNSLQLIRSPFGEASAKLMPRFTGNVGRDGLEIFSEAARARIGAMSKGHGRLRATMQLSRRRYIIEPVHENVPLPFRSDDPMIALRTMATLPDLGEHPFSEAFLEHHSSQIR